MDQTKSGQMVTEKAEKNASKSKMRRSFSVAITQTP